MIQATVTWSNTNEQPSSHRYSRAHSWRFDGGVVVPASSSPDIVPVPMSDPAAVDPEEAFLASLSSCHMLWFLSLAHRDGFFATTYNDEATGEMRPNEHGKLYVAEVILRPRIEWAPPRSPSETELAELHHRAHLECFLANSVHTQIRIE